LFLLANFNGVENGVTVNDGFSVLRYLNSSWLRKPVGATCAYSWFKTYYLIILVIIHYFIISCLSQG